MDNETSKYYPKTSTQTRIINSALLILTLWLATRIYVTFADIIILIGRSYIENNVTIIEQQRIQMGRLQSAWEVIGGGIFILFAAASLEHHIKRIPSVDTRRVLLITCAIEVVLIAIGRVILLFL